MDIKTHINGLQLLRSEMLHISDTNTITIEIDSLSLIFEFNNNDSKHPAINKEVPDPQTLKIKCWNFKKPLGEGVLTPIEVGIINDDKLFLSFFVWTPDPQKESKILNYCLYLG